MATNWMVRTEVLTKLYDGTVRALDGVNLSVEQGELLAVMGPSGSGKSTLLHLLGALDRPTSGEVYVAGQRLAEIRDVDAFRSRTVGFVFQLHNLIPTLTARENVEVPMLGRRRQSRAQALLELLGLADRANHRPAKLSGGERQRVAIARALANEPQLLLADEPTGNLDSSSGAEVMDAFQRLNQEQGTTVLVVTHDTAVARATRRVVVLRDGKVERDEAVRDPYWHDLQEFKASGLGQSLLEGRVPQAVLGVGLEALLTQLQGVLSAV